MDMVGGFPRDTHLSIGKSCFQTMVCSKGFQFYRQYQQTLGWEKIVFSRPGFIPYLTLSSSMGNFRDFLRFLLIPSRYLNIGLVVENEDLPLHDSFGLVLGWTW
jgi:hypothetical protein